MALAPDKGSRHLPRRWQSIPTDDRPSQDSTRWLSAQDAVASVGGKNASLGDMLRNLDSRGIRVPLGFVTTADAYWRFIDTNRLGTLIASKVAELKEGKATVTETGSAIRSANPRGRVARRLG